MNKIRIVFWGTPEFSIPSLIAFQKNPRIKILAVVTQQDKPIKRSGTPVPPPLKKIAKKYNIPVLQPSNLHSIDFIKSIGTYDFNIVVAYGKIIPTILINYPDKSSLNLHPSALPKYRGPAPIHYALLHGDISTAITVIEIDEKMDHGPILIQKNVIIEKDDNYTTLLNRLSDVGAKLLVQVTIDYFDKKIIPIKQVHTKATYTKLLSKNDGELNLNLQQRTIYNKIRALNPWPSTFTFWGGKRLKILDARPIKATTLAPGKVVYGNNAIHIGTRDGDMDILSLQREGKKIQKASEFIKGNPTLNEKILPN